MMKSVQMGLDQLKKKKKTAAKLWLEPADVIYLWAAPL